MEVVTVPRTRSPRAHQVAIRTAIGLGAGAILIVTFLRLVDIGGVLNRLQHLSIGFALLCGVVFLAAYVVRALRWRCLLRPYEVSVRNVVVIYQVATFLNWLLPIRAGEIAKSLLLRRSDGIPVSRSLATVSMDKAMDLLPAVALIAILPFLSLDLSRALWVLLISALVVVVVVALLLALILLRPERTMDLLTSAARVLPAGARQRVEPFIVNFVDTLLALVRQPRLLLLAAGYTIVAVSLDALFCLLAFRAVGEAVPLPIVLYGYTFFNLAFILPTPPGQVGSNELIGLMIFSGLFSIDRSGVGAMFLFSHPWTAALMTISGLLCLSVLGLSFRGTLRLAEDQERARA